MRQRPSRQYNLIICAILIVLGVLWTCIGVRIQGLMLLACGAVGLLILFWKRDKPS